MQNLYGKNYGIVQDQKHISTIIYLWIALLSTVYVTILHIFIVINTPHSVLQKQLGKEFGDFRE